MNEIKEIVNIKCRTDEKCLQKIENICQNLDVTPKKIKIISRMFDLYSSSLNIMIKKNLNIFYNNLLYQLEHERKMIVQTKKNLLRRSFGATFPEANEIILSFLIL
jgi:hypothetical protein